MKDPRIPENYEERPDDMDAFAEEETFSPAPDDVAPEDALWRDFAPEEWDIPAEKDAAERSDDAAETDADGMAYYNELVEPTLFDRAEEVYETPTDAMLSGTQTIPELIGQDLVQTEDAPQPEGEATYVPRPVQKKKSTARKTLRVLAVIGKWLIALVLAAAILVGGLVGYLTVAEYTPAYAENARRGTVNLTALPDATQTMRIVTFNTGYAALGEDADFFLDGGTGVNPDSEDTVLTNMRGVARVLKSADADFVFLQEVDTDSDRSFHQNQWLQYEHELEFYESRFALNYSCDFVPYPLSDFIGEVHSGISTLSRYDISSATRYSLPCPFSWPTRVANLKRCLLVTRVPLSKEENAPELVLVNFHLEAYDDGEGKEAQTEQLLALVEAEYAKGNYVIAGGDFNQTFVDALRRYPIKSTSGWEPGVLSTAPFGWQYAYDSSTPTCRLLNQPYAPSSSLTQYFVIDGFLVSPNVKVERIETLDEGFVYSDHNPVAMDFSLLPNTSANSLVS